MMSEDPQIVGESIEGTGRHCDHCGYNLTGLLCNRCPECGHVFDRTQFPKHRYPTAGFILIALQGCATLFVLLLAIFVLNERSHAPRGGIILGDGLWRATFVLQIPLAMLGWILGGFANAANGHKRLWWTFSIVAFALTAMTMVLSR